MPKESKELRDLRSNTPSEPAPMPSEAPPMLCPACGWGQDAFGCTNGECSEYSGPVDI